MKEPEKEPVYRWRRKASSGDPERVRRLIGATGFFSQEEIAVAVELVEERLLKGPASGYQFLFAERAGKLLGYTCFGRIPATQDSYDLYWIAVDPDSQGLGLGRQLLKRSENLIAAAGGRCIYIETSARAKYAPTREFYKRCAYQLQARLENFYAPGDDKLIFSKNLASQAACGA